MSKSRMTFRFEPVRRASGGTGGVPVREAAAPAEEHRSEPIRSGEVRGEPAGDERDIRAGNVIPLKHYEFEAASAPDPSYPYDYGAWSDTAAAEADELERLIRSSSSESQAARSSLPRQGGKAERAPVAPRFDPLALRPGALDQSRAKGGKERMRSGAHPKADGFESDAFDGYESADESESFGESGYWPTAEADRDEGPRTTRRARAIPVRASGSDGPAWWKVGGAVVGAVATGILFGTFLLNFFAGDSGTGDAGVESAGGQPPIVQSGGLATGGESSAAATPPAPEGAADAGAETPPAFASVDLPERRMWLLQNGKFETLDAARTLVDSMRGKGLAATIEQGDGFYVYAGVTSSRDAALRAGVKLQAAGVEVYVKPYELPPVQQVRWADGSADALSGYIGKGGGLVRMIGDLTLVHLEGAEAVAMEAATLEKVRAEHLALQEFQPSALAGLPADARPILERMDGAARDAVMALGEYGAHPDHAYLWTAQSALMDYVIAEKQLLTTIATQ